MSASAVVIVTILVNGAIVPSFAPARLRAGHVMGPIAPIVAGLGLLLSTSVAAQVGYPPTKSPYIDLEQTQELTLLVGSFHAQRDPAAVAPQGGMLVGAHYEWRAGGPAHLIADLSRISSNRDLLNRELEKGEIPSAKAEFLKNWERLEQ